MSDTTHLICWNCGKRTPLDDSDNRKCVHCEVEVRTSAELFPKDDSVEYQEVINVKLEGNVQKKIIIKEFKAMVNDLFPVKNFIFNKNPIFIVSPPEGNFDETLKELNSRTAEYLPGFKVRVSHRYIYGDKEMSLSFFYLPKVLEPKRRISVNLFFLTIMSVFLAGMYNYAVIQTNGGKILDNVFNVEFSFDSFIYSLQFSGTLILILLIKDINHILAALRRTKPTLISYFIPVLPSLFELGTLGSLVLPATIPESRNKMFNSAFIGPFVGWLLSATIFILTLPLKVYDPTTALNYSEHSVILNNNYEPLFLKILSVISPEMQANLSTNYVLHPITLAALAGIYICGIYLVPAAHLNGGYLLKSTTNDLVHRISTYVFIIFFSLITPFVGLFLLVLYWIKGTPVVLNDITAVSRLKKGLFIITIIFALLSLPLPLTV